MCVSMRVWGAAHNLSILADFTIQSDWKFLFGLCGKTVLRCWQVDVSFPTPTVTKSKQADRHKPEARPQPKKKYNLIYLDVLGFTNTENTFNAITHLDNLILYGC